MKDRDRDKTETLDEFKARLSRMTHREVLQAMFTWEARQMLSSWDGLAIDRAPLCANEAVRRMEAGDKKIDRETVKRIIADALEEHGYYDQRGYKLGKETLVSHYGIIVDKAVRDQSMNVGGWDVTAHLLIYRDVGLPSLVDYKFWETVRTGVAAHAAMVEELNAAVLAIYLLVR